MASEKNRKASAGSREEQVTVEVLDDRTLVHVGTLGELVRFNEDPTEEPRMSVTDVAKRARRPADEVRRVARAWAKRSENFNPFEIRVESGGRSPAFTELWLSEAEVLFLCTKLRGEVPEKITWEMVDVYMKARRGLLGPSMDPALASEMRHALSEHREERKTLRAEIAKANEKAIEAIAKVAMLESRANNDYGYVSDAWVKEHISDPLWKLALYMHAADAEKTISGRRTKSDPKEKTLRGHHRALSNKLRNLIGHNGQGSSWKKLQRIPALMQFVDNWIREQLQTAMKEATQDVLLKVAEETAKQKAARSGQMILQMASYRTKAKK